MKRFINWNGETVDELRREDFATAAAFHAELRRLVAEYAMAGMGGAYVSRRACGGW